MISRLRDALARRKAKSRGSSKRSAASIDDNVVAIEYSPHIDGDPDPGEIVWTWVPYEEDPTQGKDRPVVVIGRRRDRLVAVPLTTRRDEHEPQVAVGMGSWDSERRISYARIERMLDIEPDAVRREGSIVEPDMFAAVVTAVDVLYDVRYPQP